MNRLLVYFIFCISIVYSCENDDDCSGHGSCQKNKCYCEWFYQGETCSDRWADKILVGSISTYFTVSTLAFLI